MNYKGSNPILKTTLLIVAHLLRIAFALVFLFSGFVKAIDPLGFAYKLDDYFQAFGPFFQKFNSLSLVISIALSGAEIVLGLMILLIVKYKTAVRISLVYMLLMTLLTLYIAFNNPVTDCGCFGDALILTNWQTFYKNILLLGIISYLSYTRTSLIQFFNAKFEWILLGLFAFSTVFISVYNLHHLPWIDFRPYKIGVNVREKMTLPEDAASEEYVITFIYEKDGVQKEFNLDNYPENDTTWKFVDQKTEIISQGAVAEIHDFVLIDQAYNDVTYDVLDYPKRTYFFVMYDLSKAERNAMELLRAFYTSNKDDSIHFYLLTASGQNEQSEFMTEFEFNIPVLTADPIALKTMIRANPGVVVLENGVIIDKMNWRDL